MKSFSNLNVEHIYTYLVEHKLFTKEELCLVLCGWGDNIDTYNTICQVRFGMDFDQLEEELPW